MKISPAYAESFGVASLHLSPLRGDRERNIQPILKLIGRDNPINFSEFEEKRGQSADHPRFSSVATR